MLCNRWLTITEVRLWRICLRSAGRALRHQCDGARAPNVIVMTWASPTGSRSVRQLLHTTRYAAPPKRCQMPPKNVTGRNIGPILLWPYASGSLIRNCFATIRCSSAPEYGTSSPGDKRVFSHLISVLKQMICVDQILKMAQVERASVVG